PARRVRVRPGGAAVIHGPAVLLLGVADRCEGTGRHGRAVGGVECQHRRAECTDVLDAELRAVRGRVEWGEAGRGAWAEVEPAAHGDLLFAGRMARARDFDTRFGDGGAAAAEGRHASAGGVARAAGARRSLGSEAALCRTARARRAGRGSIV